MVSQQWSQTRYTLAWAGMLLKNDGTLASEALPQPIEARTATGYWDKDWVAADYRL